VNAARVLRRAVPALWLAGAAARAEFSIPGYELVQTCPVETTLCSADLRDPATVWSELFDGARREIVIGQFYVAGKAGTPIERVLASLEAAGARGVRIRFLLEQRGVAISDAATIARLRRIPNLELRLLAFGQLTGTGIIHAKYTVVDGRAAFVGSQNFDWRSFQHIHETGLRITDAPVVAQLQAIFDQDWRAQALLAAGQAVPAAGRSVAALPLPAQLVASPAAYNPPGVADSQATLPQLLAAARREVRVDLLDYAPLGYGPNGTRPYYAVIDDAVRAAAARGVRIKLLVSNWNTEAAVLPYLKSLAMLPTVEIRILTLPAWSGGPVPFARVLHSKTMVIDDEIAWIGTSNWGGGYFDTSRNLELVLRDAAMARRVAALHEQAWSSPYAAPLEVMKTYPAPNKAGEPPKETR
jgi:phosphatidylserine/phosphatidylglycerophosphate/cardiolipin synthase-like enzyme